MSNSRLLFMGLGLVLVLVVAGFAVISVSGKLQTEDSAVASPSASEVTSTGAASTPSTPSASDASSGSGTNAANTQAAGQSPQGNAASTDANTTNNSNVQAVYCPRQSELFKKDQFWYGPNSWRDYSPSFASHINNFAGAQWVGVNIGKIICLYKGLEVNDFPIAVERDNLMKKPVGTNWKADVSGYQICKSDRVEDCPFFPETAKSNENIYDFLKEMKKN